MNRWFYRICCVGVLMTSTLAAQENTRSVLGSARNQFAPEVAPRVPRDATYERYETARQLVQRKAALKSAQRRERIAANKAIGYSPLRPATSPASFTGAGTRPIVVWYTPFLGPFYPIR